MLEGIFVEGLIYAIMASLLRSYVQAFIVLLIWALIDYKFTGWENTAFIWLLGGAAASKALMAGQRRESQR